MASKTRIADVSAAYDTSDTMSVGDVFGGATKKKARKATDAIADPGQKRAKTSLAATAAPAQVSFVAAASADISGLRPRRQGKSRFYMESIRLLRGQLLGHGQLRLDSHPEDYGEMRLYSGSSSSGEMTPTKEETYNLARALGAPSSSRVIAHVDYRAIGLLPERAAADFADECGGSFSAPEVERDLLKVPHESLTEAVNFHAASVSALRTISFIVLSSTRRDDLTSDFLFAGYASDSNPSAAGSGVSLRLGKGLGHEGQEDPGFGAAAGGI
jgi:hypothetical protein